MGEIVVDEAPREQMNRFLAKYSVEVRSVARKAIAKLRVRLPGAIELVYDNYNALAIGFSSSERAADVIVSIALIRGGSVCSSCRGRSFPIRRGSCVVPAGRCAISFSATPSASVNRRSTRSSDQPLIAASRFPRVVAEPS